MKLHRDPAGISLLLESGQIRLQVITESIVRCVYTLAQTFADDASHMVLPQNDATHEWEVTETNDSVTLTTRRLRLEIDRRTGAFAWYNASRELLVREPAAGGKHLEQVDVEKHIFDSTNLILTTEQTADGTKIRTEGGRVVVDRTAYTTRLDLVFSKDEAIYGLGQHEEGILNYRGQSQYLYQQNMKVAMPVIVSTRGYGILWDTNGLAAFHDDRHGTYFWTECDDEMDFYFIVGPELDDVVAGIRTLTGRPTMFPRWAYGYIQSKERYKSQDELIAIATEYRRRSIPLDCIVLDWMSWEGDLWGQKTFDPERFPNPDVFIDDLHSMDIKLMISIWPIFRNNGANHVEMRDHNFLLGNDSTYDAFNADARALYWEQANTGLFCHGVDAWWCDCSEPFECDWKGAIKPEPWKRVEFNTQEAKKYLDPEFINAYSLLHSRGIYEGQRSITDAKRVVNLTRSGFPGQQRYGAITWSGDIAANWETLRRQIADGLNFCVTGNPKWTFDVGAFFVRNKPDLWFWSGEYQDGCDDKGYRELYVRWLQVGTFLPMFRSHGTDTPREVWRFGKPGEVTYDTLVKFINLRYRLLPYLYSLAALETQAHYTSMRLLAFDFRSDVNVYDVADQFMCGPAFLVCPVLEPMYYGPDSHAIEGGGRSRTVYLPAGTDWFDFWSGEPLQGGQTTTVEATLDTMPLFVRSGSIVPLGPLVQYADEKTADPIELRIYGGANGSFDWYEDENDGYGYERGHYATVRIQWNDAENTLEFGERIGSFPGIAVDRQFHVVYVSPNSGTGINARTDTGISVTYSGKRKIVSVSR